MIKKSRSTIDFNPLAEVELPDTKSSLKTTVKRKKVVKNTADSSPSLKDIAIGKNKKSIEFLDELEKKRSSRYRNVAIYIKDIVRITFFARFLKKARFLANFSVASGSISNARISVMPMTL